MKHKVALITDSTCNIPADLIEQYQITRVPLYILWGAEHFREGVDLQPEQFYERLVSSPKLPTTSQPTPQDFLEAYRKVRQAGAEEIVAITISSALSGTINSARQASEAMDVPVHVLDSKSTTMGLGWQVLAAARAREDGGDAQAMLAAAEQVRSRVVLLVTLNTLEYLHKGGRIGGATRFIGTVLDLKPQIYVDHNTGRVEAGERARTREKSLEVLYSGFFKQVDPQHGLRIAVLYTTGPQDAQRLAERVRAEYHPQELLVAIGTPVLGVHTGPGTVALCGYALADH